MGLVTLAKVKSASYLDISATTYDVEMQLLIDDVSGAVNTYMDRDTDYTIDTVTAGVSDAVCQEVAFRWRHRTTPGQIRHDYEGGSSDKFTVDEFIPSVKQVLDRHREIDIMGG